MFRFGKRPAANDYRTLRFENYAAAMPTPPKSFDQLPRAVAGAGGGLVAKLFPMDGNDRYGDCTIAGLAHAETMFSGLIGSKNIMSVAAVEKLYFRLSGGVDSGLNMIDVVNYWRGTAANSIVAYVKIDPKNHVHVKQAIRAFGGVYLGFQVTSQTIAQFNAGKPWTPGKLLNEGHAVFATGYTAADVGVLTWGATQRGTWAWWNQCVDEAYAVLPVQAEKNGFSDAFDFQTLQADLSQVAG